MDRVKYSLVLTSLLVSQLSATKPIQLDTIYITTASNTKQNFLNTTSNIDIITKDDLEEKHYVNVVEALYKELGVSFTTNGGLGQSTSLYLRGLDTKKVLVLIDGIRVNDPSNIGGVDVSNLLINNIERIEVLKGAQSGIWGADASAGVINIITSKDIKTDLFLEYGSFNTKKVMISTGKKSDTYIFKIGGNFLKSDGFTAMKPKEANKDDFEDDGYENKSINLNISTNINENDKLSAGFNFIDAKSEFDAGNWEDSIEKKANSHEEEKSISKLYNLKYILDRGAVKSNFYLKGSDFSRDFYYENGFEYSFKGDIKEYGFKTRFNHQNDSFTMIGAEYKRFNHDKVGTYNNRALYLTNSTKINNLNIINLAIRGDEFNKFKNKITYKVGLKHYHKFLDNFISSFNYSTAYNTPSVYQLSGPYGNESLIPEDTKGYDISLTVNDLKVTYFKNETKDMIDFDMSTFKYNNISKKSTIRGVEVSYFKSIDVLSSTLKLNYNYLDTHLLRRPKHTFVANYDYYGIENLHLGVNLQYIGKRKDIGEVDTGRYTVINLISNYYLSDKVTLFAKVDNITDRNYQEVDGYATSGINAYIGLKASY